MKTLKSLAGIALCASLFLCSGCSRSGTAASEHSAQQAAKTVQSAVESTDVTSRSTAAVGGKTQQSSARSEQRRTSANQPDVQRQSSTRSSKKALTAMNIEAGVRREYQNGPTEDEIEKYRRLANKKAAPKTYRPEQTTDPVFDSEMMTVK